MEWLRIPFAFLIVLASSFGALFLSAAWERRRRRDPVLGALLALLPGKDCGLCGADDCRHYAKRLLEEGADPSLCAPGGLPVEESLRKSLGGERGTAKFAFVRCGGSKSEAADLFAYEGREDCGAAKRLFGGQKRCADACLGLGSCARACPLGAISVREGLASVDPGRCSGCGACVAACPQGLIALAPQSARWYVACASKRPPEERKADCKVACVACGDCQKLSANWEFSMEGGLARASTTVPEKGAGAGAFEGIAARCPTRAILKAGAARGKAETGPAEAAKKP